MSRAVITANSALNDLRSLLGADAVRADVAGDAPELTDYRRQFHGRALAIVEPDQVSQVSSLLRWCHEHRVGLVPQGGNTGYCGGATPDATGQQVLLLMHRLNRVRAVDPNNFAITVEAGCTLQQVQDAAAATDRFFPLSLGSQGSCQIGGNLATNAGGLNVVRFGMARDLTLGIEAVLADGSLLEGLNTLRKDNTGYDLKSLLIGSEGTLGVITAATLKLWPAIRSTATALLGLRTPEDAMQLFALLRAHAGERLSSFELMPRAAVALALQHLPDMHEPLTALHTCYVLCELTSAADEALDHLLGTALAGSAMVALIEDGAIAINQRQRAAFWSLREGIPDAQRRAGASLKHDISVPPASIPEFMTRVTDWVGTHVPEGLLICYGHAGDGNLHCNVSSRPGTDRAKFQGREMEVRDAIHGVVRSLHGSISAEHGIGQFKVAELQRYASPIKLALMRQLKLALDPAGIMNPGKLL